MHHIISKLFTTGFLIFLLFISVRIDLEQTVKDLQAQNIQFQATLMTLAKGQQELMTTLTTKKKKKKALINMGKRFKEPILQVQIVEDSSEEDEN